MTLGGPTWPSANLPRVAKPSIRCPYPYADPFALVALIRGGKWRWRRPWRLCLSVPSLRHSLSHLDAVPGRNAPSFGPCFLVERFGFCHNIILCFLFEFLALFP